MNNNRPHHVFIIVNEKLQIKFHWRNMHMVFTGASIYAYMKDYNYWRLQPIIMHKTHYKCKQYLLNAYIERLR